MVKGISRRVVVVRPDGHAPFEQAIFLVRDCAVPSRDAVREACRIANGYLGRRPVRRRAHWLRLLAVFTVGAASASLIWATVWLLL